MICMCLHPSFGTTQVIMYLTTPPKKDAPSGGKKTMNNNKLIIGKYNTLTRILQDGDLFIEPPMHKEALRFSIQGVQHQLQDIRTQAIKSRVELYKVMGGKIRDSFTELRPAQIESIEQAFVDAGAVPNGPEGKKNQQINVATNINPSGAKAAKNQ